MPIALRFGATASLEAKRPRNTRTRVTLLSKWVVFIACAVILLVLEACGDRGDRELWLKGSKPSNTAIPKFVRVAPQMDLQALAIGKDDALVVVGDGGDILRSVNGGATWAAVANSGTTNHLRSVVVSPKGALVAVGDHDTIVRSADGGATWAAVANSETTNDLFSVIVEPKGALVAVGDKGAIRRSTDGGATWAPVTNSGTKNTLVHVAAGPSGALIAVGVAGTIVRSADSGVSWAKVNYIGVGHSLESVIVEPKGALLAVGSAGIVRSTDGGVAWQRVAETGPLIHLRSLTVEPKGALVAVGEAGAIVRSTDGGATWTVVTNSGTRSTLMGVIVEPKGALIAVGSNGAILRSTDGGVTWEQAADSGTESTLFKVIVEPSGAMVAVGELGAIVRSVDGGATWAKVTNKLTKRTPLWSLLVEPGGALVAVGDYGAIVRSTDSGATWAVAANSGRRATLRSVISEHMGALVAVGFDGLIVRSTDGGVSWAEVANSDTKSNLHSVIGEPKGALVAVGDGGVIVRSTDSGATWVKVTSGTESYLQSVVVGPGGSLVAVGEDGRIVRSTDGGVTWVTVNSRGSNLLSVVVAPKGALVAVGEGGAIVHSTDGGTTWAAITHDLTTNTLMRVIVESGGALIAVGFRGTILRSPNGGTTWSLAAVSGMKVEAWRGVPGDLWCVTVERNGALVAASSSDAIVRSIDGGKTWSALTNSGDESAIWSVIVEPKGSLVAVGDHGRIERGDMTTTIAPSISRVSQHYDQTGRPVLRLSLGDPSGLCPEAKCLSIEAQSADDHSRLLPPRPMSAELVSERMPGTVDATIPPKFVSAAPQSPIYARIRVSVPGYNTAYPSVDGYFEVENHADPIYMHGWFVTLAASLLIVAMLYTALLTKPLWLLSLTMRPALFDVAPKAGVPGVGELLVGLLRAVLLPVLVRHPRVLDAWIGKYGDVIRRCFETAAQSAAGRMSPYAALPLDGPEGERIDPSASTLARLFRNERCCIQVVGQGGAGKTRLAIEMGRWFFNGDLTSHPAGAIFVDEEFSDLSAVVLDKLKTFLPNDAPPPEFAQALLSQGRICVIVDRISERQQATRDAMTKLYRKMSPKMLICTTRYLIAVDGVASTEIRPRRLDASTLLAFLGEQLRESQASDLFPGLANQSALATQLARQITVGGRELPVTPLLVRVFVAQAIEFVRARGVSAIDDLPANVPEAYFAYVEQLDQTKRSLETDNIDGANMLRRAAALIAYVELGDDFRPKSVLRSVLDLALQADTRTSSSKVDFLRRMEANGLLVRRPAGTEEAIEYILDPLAECLAAFEHARLCGSDAQRWLSLLAQVADRGEDAKGFMLALQMNYAAYAQPLGFPPVSFPQGLKD